MRYVFLLLFLFPVLLFAQVTPIGKGWQLSLTLEPSWQRKLNVTPSVTSMDTVARTPFDGNTRQIRFPRRPDTVRFAGTETIYFAESALSRSVRREKAIFELLAGLRLHYRTRYGLEFSAGLFYRRTEQDGRIASTDDFPEQFYYRSTSSTKTYYATAYNATYHFLQQKRFQPYAGIELRTGLVRQQLTAVTAIFPAEDREEQRLAAILPQFRTQTIFDFELRLLAGVNYQLADRWSVGLATSLNRFLLPGLPNALQVRYRLGNPATAL